MLFKRLFICATDWARQRCFARLANQPSTVFQPFYLLKKRLKRVTVYIQELKSCRTSSFFLEQLLLQPTCRYKGRESLLKSFHGQKRKEELQWNFKCWAFCTTETTSKNRSPQLLGVLLDSRGLRHHHYPLVSFQLCIFHSSQVRKSTEILEIHKRTSMIGECWAAGPSGTKVDVQVPHMKCKYI